MPESRLYDEEAARAFLGGRDPHKLCEPLRLWGQKMWDRKALDAALDRLSGLVEAEPELDAADQWLADQGIDLEVPEFACSPSYVYVMTSPFAPAGSCKIGLSRQPDIRAVQLGLDLFWVAKVPDPNVTDIEWEAHQDLKHVRFRHGGATEWFGVPPEQGVAALSSVIDQSVRKSPWWRGLDKL